MANDPHEPGWRVALHEANAAPRCGARAKRTGGLPCKAAAMANGRCYHHGGKSTGPKTADGLERSRKSNWKHGQYSREAKADRAQATFRRKIRSSSPVISVTGALRNCANGRILL
jgi:hypothetical protein